MHMPLLNACALHPRHLRDEVVSSSVAASCANFSLLLYSFLCYFRSRNNGGLMWCLCTLVIFSDEQNSKKEAPPTSNTHSKFVFIINI